MSTLLETAEYIIKAIVATPENISITSSEVDGVITILVTAPSDIVGQIIGKDGRIIKAIRTILNLAFPQIRYTIDVTS